MNLKTNTKRVRFCDEINKSLHEIKELEASDDDNSYDNQQEFNGDDDESEEYEDDYELDPDELDEYDFDDKFSDEDFEGISEEAKCVGLPKIQDLKIISANDNELQDNESQLLETSIGENIQELDSKTNKISELSVSPETKHENEFSETQSTPDISLKQVNHLSENINLNSDGNISTVFLKEENDSIFKKSENSSSEKQFANTISKTISENFSSSNSVQNKIEQTFGANDSDKSLFTIPYRHIESNICISDKENEDFTEVLSQICENESQSKSSSKQNENNSQVNEKIVLQSIESKTENTVCDSNIVSTPNINEEINCDSIQDSKSVAKSSLKKTSENTFIKGYSENIANRIPDSKDRVKKMQSLKYTKKMQNRGVFCNNLTNIKHKKQTERLNSELTKAAINGTSITELKETVYKTWLKIKSGNGKKGTNENEIKNISNDSKESHKNLPSEAAFITWKKSKNKARLKNKIKDIPPVGQKNISKCDDEENILAFKFWKQKKDEDSRKVKTKKYINEQQKLESKDILDTTRKIEAQAAFTAWKAHKSLIRKLSKEKMKLELERQKNIATIKEAKDKLAQEMYDLWLESKNSC